MSNLEVPTIHSSQAEVWYLKRISFRGNYVQIITQNFNGPCSFIALCNILILRGNILIEPPTRQTVSYEFLSQLVAEYLLIRSPNVDISDALSIMPHTQKGLDLNPLFTSPTSFLAATQTAGGELKLFSQVGIDLVHGWLVDPESQEAQAMREEGTEDYDSAVGLIAEADHIAGGLLVPGHGGRDDNDSERKEDWTDAERRKIQNALTIRHFLEQTQSQFTYHGLFYLASTLPTGSLVALFRSSHLSVLYKHDEDTIVPNDGQVDEDGWEKAQGEWRVLDVSAASGSLHPGSYDTERNGSAQAIQSELPSITVPVSVQSKTESEPTPTPTPPALNADQHQIPIPTQAPQGDLPSATVSVPEPASAIASELEMLHVTDPPSSSEVHSPTPITEEPPPSHPSTSTTPFQTSAPTDSPPQQGARTGTKTHVLAHTSSLYTLATDQVFLSEPSVIWERIEDIDGAAGVFVDSSFLRATPLGGDWAGHTAEDAVGDYHHGASISGEGMSDHELARQLQAEEEHYVQRAQEAYLQQEQKGREAREEERRQKELHVRREKGRKEGKKKECVIM